jgi:hypothetical protein
MGLEVGDSDQLPRDSHGASFRCSDTGWEPPADPSLLLQGMGPATGDAEAADPKYLIGPGHGVSGSCG